MTDSIQIENAKLREVLAKIGAFAEVWEISANNRGEHWSGEHFGIMEQTCIDALEQPATPKVALTCVMVCGKVYTGTLVDSNPKNFEGCVEIEVVDMDPACARMRVIGTPTARINEPPVTIGSVE